MRRTLNSTSLFVFALAMLGAMTLQAQDEAPESAEPNEIPRAESPNDLQPVPAEPGMIADSVTTEGAYVEGNVGHIHSGTCTNCYPRPGRNPDLFYNYYQPPGCGTAAADLYMSPGEVPRHVGHTYITYQPLMPHEFMYPHHRTYYQFYDGGRGLNRTSIKYYHAPFRKVGHGLHQLRIAR